MRCIHRWLSLTKGTVGSQIGLRRDRRHWGAGQATVVARWSRFFRADDEKHILVIDILDAFQHLPDSRVGHVCGSA